MKASMDKAGRVVIPVAIRERLGLRPGTVFEVRVDDFALHLVPERAGARLVKEGGRWIARPAQGSDGPDLDPAALIAEERERWPG